MVKLKHQFPESFFEEEDRLGYHIDRKRKEVWAVELDMLYELDRVCKKLNIPYFLDGGTLLGAARDGRFIPWDDDIDVSMLREDYDRFVREAPGEFTAPLFLQTGYTDPDYFRGHSQLRNSATCAILPEELGNVPFNQGIFLDIFVLDDLFEDRVLRQYEEREALWARRWKWFHHDYHRNPLRRAVRWCRYLIYRRQYPDSASFYARLEEIFRSKEKSELIDYLMLNRNADEVHRLQRSWYEEAVPIPFMGRDFPAPKGYAEYLRCYYGEDWRTPKQRPSMHDEPGPLLRDTDRSYSAVLKELEEKPEKYYEYAGLPSAADEEAAAAVRPKVTVIMPSLNVGDYIRECMESVVNQSLKEIEILCVDAGSADGTLEILQEYAAKDPRVRLLHSEVRSYGHQVNMGLDAAAGEYIGIVETDDYIAPEMYRRLYAAAVISGKPDVVKSPFFSLNPPGEEPVTVEYATRAHTGNVFPFSSHTELVTGHPSIWSAIYKRAFIKEKKIRMKEAPGGGWVDNPFLFRTMCESGRICWVNEPFYYYRRTNPTASTHLKDCSIPFDRVNEIKDYLDANRFDPVLEEHLFYRTIYYIGMLRGNPNLTKENLEQIKATLKRFSRRAVRNTLRRKPREVLRSLLWTYLMQAD